MVLSFPTTNKAQKIEKLLRNNLHMMQYHPFKGRGLRQQWKELRNVGFRQHAQALPIRGHEYVMADIK